MAPENESIELSYSSIYSESSYTDNIASIILYFYDSIQKALPPSDKVTDSLSKGISVLADYFQQLQLSSYNTEEQCQLRLQYEKWGDFGWTPFPFSPTSDFPAPPDCIESADLLILPLFKDNILLDLFQKISDLSDVPSDFSDAIWAFNAQRYRVCSLILFSLLERAIICSQSLDSVMKDNRRVANCGIRKVQNQYQNAFSEDMLLFVWLLSHNVISCLSAFYVQRPNFTNEPILINRHFIEHGMSTRLTTKTDCLKLFLLYYNLLFLTEWIKNTSKYSTENKEV